MQPPHLEQDSWKIVIDGSYTFGKSYNANAALQTVWSFC